MERPVESNDAFLGKNELMRISGMPIKPVPYRYLPLLIRCYAQQCIEYPSSFSPPLPAPFLLLLLHHNHHLIIILLRRLWKISTPSLPQHASASPSWPLPLVSPRCRNTPPSLASSVGYIINMLIIIITILISNYHKISAPWPLPLVSPRCRNTRTPRLPRLLRRSYYHHYHLLHHCIGHIAHYHLLHHCMCHTTTYFIITYVIKRIPSFQSKTISTN